MKKSKNIFSRCSTSKGCKQVEEPWEIVAWLACLSFWKKNSTSKTNNKKFQHQINERSKSIYSRGITFKWWIQIKEPCKIVTWLACLSFLEKYSTSRNKSFKHKKVLKKHLLSMQDVQMMDSNRRTMGNCCLVGLFEFLGKILNMKKPKFQT